MMPSYSAQLCSSHLPLKVLIKTFSGGGGGGGGGRRNYHNKEGRERRGKHAIFPEKKKSYAVDLLLERGRRRKCRKELRRLIVARGAAISLWRFLLLYPTNDSKAPQPQPPPPQPPPETAAAAAAAAAGRNKHPKKKKESSAHTGNRNACSR